MGAVAVLHRTEEAKRRGVTTTQPEEQVARPHTAVPCAFATSTQPVRALVLFGAQPFLVSPYSLREAAGRALATLSCVQLAGPAALPVSVTYAGALLITVTFPGRDVYLRRGSVPAHLYCTAPPIYTRRAPPLISSCAHCLRPAQEQHALRTPPWTVGSTQFSFPITHPVSILSAPGTVGEAVALCLCFGIHAETRCSAPCRRLHSTFTPLHTPTLARSGRVWSPLCAARSSGGGTGSMPLPRL